MKFSKIILVDDNPTTIFYYSDLLQEFETNAEIISFQDGTLFLDYIKKNHNDLSLDSILLIMDINMPNNTGFELIEELEENYDELNNMITLMVTSSNLKSDYEKYTRFQQIKAYIEKPLTIDKLTNTLKTS